MFSKNIHNKFLMYNERFFFQVGEFLTNTKFLERVGCVDFIFIVYLIYEPVRKIIFVQLVSNNSTFSLFFSLVEQNV